MSLPEWCSWVGLVLTIMLWGLVERWDAERKSYEQARADFRGSWAEFRFALRRWWRRS